MTMYNMLFGRNPQSTLLYAVIGLKENDIERPRDVFVSEDGKQILVYTRTGGGNREDYPNLLMRSLASWEYSCDDDYDSTYCTDAFNIPEDFIQDVNNLEDIMTNGLRKEFGQHLVKTLNRELTESDKETAIYNQHAEVAKKLKAHGDIDIWNGHTIVPLSDNGMEALLTVMEKNKGQFEGYWGVLPYKPEITLNSCIYSSLDARLPDIEKNKRMVVVGNPSKWVIDKEWWGRWKEKFSAKYPISIAKIAEEVAREETPNE